MKTILSLSLLIFLAFSCGDKKTSTDGTNPDSSKTTASSSTSAKGSEEVVMKFYTSYLKDYYNGETNVAGPAEKLNDKGIYQLDIKVHENYLSTSGFFSKKFLENELPKFKACDEALKKIDGKKAKAEGGSPFDLVQGNACDFMHFQVWTGGQGEFLNKVDIFKSDEKAETSTVYALLGDTTGTKYSYPKVSLAKENNQWKITAIEVGYDEPK